MTKTDKDASTQLTDDENYLMRIVDSIEEDRTESEFEFRNQSQAVDLLPSKYAISELHLEFTKFLFLWFQTLNWTTSRQEMSR